MNSIPEPQPLNLIELSKVLVAKARQDLFFSSRSLISACGLPSHMRRRVAEVIMVWEGTGLVKRLSKGYNAEFQWLSDL